MKKTINNTVFRTLTYVAIAAFTLIVLFVINLKSGLQRERHLFLQQEEHLTNQVSLRIEKTMEEMFYAARTISLLPSVRSISGDNLSVDFEHDYDSSRFSGDAYATVQQLYNNLASSVNVSEIYCVLDGFEPESHQKPFFMFDQLIMKEESDVAGESEQVAHDFPEELEDEEYSVHVEQLEYFRANYPTFNFENLDDIPMVIGPAVRTCDNSQYQSESEGDVKNSYGLLFSSPIYAHDESFIGIISVIVRTNVFEAQLLDRPFIPVNDDEVQIAAEQGWSLPTEMGRFVLSNSAHDISIYDRRYSTLPTEVESHKSAIEFTQKELRSPTVSQWKMLRLNNLGDLKARQTPLYTVLLFQIITILLIAGFACVIIISAHNRKILMEDMKVNLLRLSRGESVDTLTVSNPQNLPLLEKLFTPLNKTIHDRITLTKAIAAGDLRISVEPISPDDTLGISLKEMTESLKEVLFQLQDVSERVREVCYKSSEANQTLADKTIQQAKKIENIHSSISEINRGTDVNIGHAENARNAIMKIKNDTKNATRNMDQIDVSMNEIYEASGEIASIIKLVDDIAFQTNLLALNASVEAARAGEHGKGFSVVADEVRNLASRSAKAAKETSDLVNKSFDKITHGRTLTVETKDSFESLYADVESAADAMGLITSLSTEQGTGISVINQNIEDVKTITVASSNHADETTQKTEELIYEINKLNDLLKQFMLN